MDRTVITKRINRLAFDIEKLKSTLAAIENTDIARYPENYNMLATDAALRSELIACRMRRLVLMPLGWFAQRANQTTTRYAGVRKKLYKKIPLSSTIRLFKS